MQNVTISIDDRLLARAREYARKQGTTFNQMVRDLVTREVEPEPGSRMRDFSELVDRLQARSEDGPMSREEVHLRG